MSTTRYEVVMYFGGHSKYQGSNKKWAAVLLRRLSEGEGTGGDDEAAIWCYLAVHGPAGTRYVGGNANPELTTRKVAEAEFVRMVKQKTGASKGYQEIAGEVTGPEGFAEFLDCFGVTLVMPESSPGAGQGSGIAAPALARREGRPRFPFAVQGVRHLVLGQLEACMADAARYGLSEKVNDLRCPLVFDGATLSAYTRNGELLLAVPPEAKPLARLGRPFVIDGGQLTGKHAGHYAVFELLAWDGEDVREWGYARRNSLLEEAMRAAGLIRRGGTTLAQGLEHSLTPGLALLTVSQSEEEARRLFAEVQSGKGEGVVVRLLDGPYGGARVAQKYKFRPTIDAIAIGIDRSGNKKVGSVTLGLVREKDGAVVEIGHVYSGLNKAAIAEIDGLLARGVYIVLEVSFLLARTDRIALDEAVTKRRADKLPWQCTTQQLIDILGEERAPLIAGVKAVPGLAFPQTTLF